MVKNKDSLEIIKFSIIGKGDLSEYTYEKRQELKDPNRIILTERVPCNDIPIYLQVANYFFQLIQIK